MKYLVLVFILLNPFYLTKNYLTQNVFAEKVSFKNIPYQDYNILLSLQRNFSQKINASGFYSINQQCILHGGFLVNTNQIKYNEVTETNTIFFNQIEGFYSLGKKSGQWKYRYEYDDGLALYEKYQLDFFYKDGICYQSEFYGVIGSAMKKTKHRFNNGKFCTPKTLIDKAWQAWTLKFNNASPTPSP